LRQIVDGAPVVGDDSVTTLSTPTTESGVTLHVLEIQFRRGAIVGEVAVSDFSGAEVAFEQVGPLAEAMVRYVDEVVARGELAIGHRALRVGDMNLNSDYEVQSRLDGVTHLQLRIGR
jgi:hypothetical protein